MKEHRELQTLIDELERHIIYQGKEVDRLREVNAELLEALKKITLVQNENPVITYQAMEDISRAAIAKAEGEQA